MSKDREVLRTASEDVKNDEISMVEVRGINGTVPFTAVCILSLIIFGSLKAFGGQ